MAKPIKSSKGKPKKVLNSKRYVEKGSVEEQRQLYELQQELLRADEDAVTFIAKNFRTKKQDTKKDIDMFTKMYYQRCLMKMAAPLQEGLSVDSVMQSVGMYAGMCLFSKDFRQSCNDMVRDAVYPYVEKKANAAGPGSVWWDRKNKMLMDKDGRIPLDSRTVAIMDLGLCRGCYNKMREPGADIEAVHAEYTRAFEALYEQAKVDGVKPEDIKHDAHVIVGKFMEADPSVAQFFENTADFSVVRDDYRTVQNEDGTVSQVWDGEFKTKDGASFDSMFVPRAPYGISTFRSMMSDMLDESFDNCPTFQDLEKAYADPKYVQKRNIMFSMMRADGFDDKTIEQSAREVLQDRFQVWADSHSDAVKDETSKRSSERDGRSSEKDGAGREVEPKGQPRPVSEQDASVNNNAEWGALPGPIAQELFNLDKDVYTKMREPGSSGGASAAFSDYLLSSREVMDKLKAEGFTSEQIMQSKWELIAKEIKEHPDSAMIWSETANGTVTWDGNSRFKTKDGKDFMHELMPRPPFTKRGAEVALAGIIDEYAGKASSSGDFKKALRNPEYVQKADFIKSMMKSDGFGAKSIDQSQNIVMQNRIMAWMEQNFAHGNGRKTKNMSKYSGVKGNISIEDMWEKTRESIAGNTPGQSGAGPKPGKKRYYDDVGADPDGPDGPQLS